jgi:hypothetical protein
VLRRPPQLVTPCHRCGEPAELAERGWQIKWSDGKWLTVTLCLFCADLYFVDREAFYVAQWPGLPRE